VWKLCFPVEDEALKKSIERELFDLYWADSIQSWRLGTDGRYERIVGKSRRMAAQSALLEDLSISP